MLTVQVNYQGVLETVRHNQAVESETNRHNIQEESVQFGNLAELTRHNKATEAIQRQNVGLGYANLAYNYSALSETRRANMAREQLTRQSNMIQAGGLSETVRTHRANEAISMFNAQTSRQSLGLERDKFEVQSAQGWQSLSNQKYANETNRFNSKVNAYNADTNRMHLGVDVYNAQTSRMNANTNRGNMYINGFNSLVELYDKKSRNNANALDLIGSLLPTD